MERIVKINVMKLANHTLLITTALVLGTGISRATPVNAGDTVFNDLFFASQDTTLEASTTGTWSLGSGNAAAHGTYTDAVYLNTFGTLDFVYQFSNASTSKVGITSTTAFSFTGFGSNVSPTGVDVGYVANGGSLPGGIFVNGSTVTPGIPDNISRSGDGSTITFNFNIFSTADNIGPGMTSAVLMVSTNASKFESGALVGLITSGATTLNGFQPTAVIPEPSFLIPLAGLSLVLGGLVAIRRKRSRILD